MATTYYNAFDDEQEPAPEPTPTAQYTPSIAPPPPPRPPKATELEGFQPAGESQPVSDYQEYQSPTQPAQDDFMDRASTIISAQDAIRPVSQPVPVIEQAAAYTPPPTAPTDGGYTPPPTVSTATPTDSGYTPPPTVSAPSFASPTDGDYAPPPTVTKQPAYESPTDAGGYSAPTIPVPISATDSGGYSMSPTIGLPPLPPTDVGGYTPPPAIPTSQGPTDSGGSTPPILSAPFSASGAYDPFSASAMSMSREEQFAAASNAAEQAAEAEAVNTPGTQAWQKAQAERDTLEAAKAGSGVHYNTPDEIARTIISQISSQIGGGRADGIQYTGNDDSPVQIFGKFDMGDGQGMRYLTEGEVKRLTGADSLNTGTPKGYTTPDGKPWDGGASAGSGNAPGEGSGESGGPASGPPTEPPDVPPINFPGGLPPLPPTKGFPITPPGIKAGPTGGAGAGSPTDTGAGAGPPTPVPAGTPDQSFGDKGSAALQARLQRAREAARRNIEEQMARRGIVGSSVEADTNRQLEADLAAQQQEGEFSIAQMESDNRFKQMAYDLQKRGMDADEAYRNAALAWQKEYGTKSLGVQEKSANAELESANFNRLVALFPFMKDYFDSIRNKDVNGDGKPDTEVKGSGTGGTNEEPPYPAPDGFEWQYIGQQLVLRPIGT